MKQLLILLLLAVPISAQTAQRVIGTNTLPATCHAGPNPQVYVDTNATTTAQFYICTSTNHWTPQGGGGSSGVSSITGTANMVIASGSTGDITLSLPQFIGTSSNVVFGTVTGTSFLSTPGYLRFIETTAPSVSTSGTARFYMDSTSHTVKFSQNGGSFFNIVPSGLLTASGLTMTTGKLLGRSTASTGAIEELTIGSGLNLSGGTLTATGSGSGTVTSIATTGPIGGGTITTTGTITCTTCVTSAASLTSTALMTGAGSQGSQTPSATTTLDSSGNILTAGSMSTGVGSGVGGNVGLGQGTATAVASTTVQLQAPTSVTGYNLVFPSAAGSGLLQWTNSTNVMTGTLTTLTSGRVPVATTNGLLTDDSDLTFSGSTLTATNLTVSTAATVGGKTVSVTVASGTSALATGAITSGTCASAVTTSATGTATTDVIGWGFNGDPTGVTGYAPSANGMLTIIAYPSADNVNFKVCNNLAGSVTPGAITLNWKVLR